MNIVIPMNQLYKGETKEVRVPHSNGVYANLSPNDDLISFTFKGEKWNEGKARKFIRNRGLNKIVWREHEDGTVVFNEIRLSSQLNVVVQSDTEQILGSEAFGKLMEIENTHGSEKPFLAQFTAMDFKGQDSVVGNRLRFDRKRTVDMIDKFGGLPIHMGHYGWFDDYKNPIGNTVAPFVDSNGNPAVYGYIYPHGEGKVFRDNLRIASAQNMLGNYPVSMAGRPIDSHILNEEEQEDEKNDGVYADVLEWEPTSMDAVFNPALEGSEVVGIVNKKLGDTKPKGKPKLRSVKSMDLTMSEIIEALKDQEYIALSDLQAVPAFKKAFEAHVKEQVNAQIQLTRQDGELFKMFLDTITDEVLLENEKVKKLIENAVTKHFDAIESAKDSVEEVAKNSEIELTKAQIYSVRGSIKEPITEQEVLELIKQAKELNDLSDIPGFSLSKDKTKEVSQTTTGGIKITDAKAEDAKSHIV